MSLSQIPLVFKTPTPPGNTFKKVFTSLWVWVSTGNGIRQEKETTKKKWHLYHRFTRVPGYGSICRAAQLHFYFFLTLSSSFLETYVRKKSRWQCVLKERGLMWSPTPGYFNYPAPVFDNHLFYSCRCLITYLYQWGCVNICLTLLHFVAQIEPAFTVERSFRSCPMLFCMCMQIYVCMCS